MQDLSLHILDIVENSIRAHARLVEILIIEDEANDVLEIDIKDDGEGMSEEMAARATDPFFTTKADRRIGLGLPFLADACREAGGSFDLTSAPGAGTQVRARFRYGHPDRKPIGEIAATLETLIVAHPGVEFVYEHRNPWGVTRLDTRQLQESCPSDEGTRTDDD